jgi:hypothetical protein
LHCLSSLCFVALTIVLTIRIARIERGIVLVTTRRIKKKKDWGWNQTKKKVWEALGRETKKMTNRFREKEGKVI